MCRAVGTLSRRLYLSSESEEVPARFEEWFAEEGRHEGIDRLPSRGRC